MSVDLREQICIREVNDVTLRHVTADVMDEGITPRTYQSGKAWIQFIEQEKRHHMGTQSYRKKMKKLEEMNDLLEDEESYSDSDPSGSDSDSDSSGDEVKE